jgi:hypothetical protein
MTRPVSLLTEKSFYSRFGDLFAMACLGASLIAVFNHLFRRVTG